MLDTSKALPLVRFLTIAAFIAVILCAVFALAMFWQRAREESRSTACAGHLYGIGSSLRSYHAKHGSYPPEPEDRATGGPAVSWRVSILLAADTDLQSYRLEEPWDSSHNRRFRSLPCGKLYSCASDAKAVHGGQTAYLGIVGAGTVWSDSRSRRISNPELDTPHKIVVIEVPDSRVLWTEPRDISVEEALVLFRLGNGFKSLRHRRGLHYLTADGSVHSFDEIADVDEFAKLLKAAD